MEKPKAITKLLEQNAVSFDAATVFKALLKTGHMIEVEYYSTTGSGELKKFRAFSRSGFEFGEDSPTAHEFMTRPEFYPSKLKALLGIVVTQLASEVDSIAD